MRISVIKVSFAWALLYLGLSAFSQDPPASALAQQGDFFSGLVVAFSATEITVDRKGLGKETAATKIFSVDPATKIEGVLKAKAHVTVRFVSGEGGAHAVHIIVR